MSALRLGMLGVTPLLATGCNGVFWGNLGVLCVTVAIFLGTVFLTRSTHNRSASRATASTSTRASSARPSVAPAAAPSVRPAAAPTTPAATSSSAASTSHHS